MSLFKQKGFLISGLVLFILVFGGFYIRTLKLGETSLSFVEPLHIYPAKSILKTGEPTLPSGNEYPRALWFSRSVALSLKIFGMNEFAARIPSAIFGTLSIILVFFMGKAFFGTTSGLIAAFMVAFIPFEVVWSRECRLYTMFQFFFLLGVFAFYKGFEKRKFDVQKTKAAHEHEKWPLRRFRFKIESLLLYWGLDWRWLLISLVSFYISYLLDVLTAIFYFSVLLYLSFMLLFTLAEGGFKRAIQSKYLSFLLLLVVVSVIGFVLFPKFVGSMINLSKLAPLWYGGQKSSKIYYLEFLLSPWLFPIAALFLIGLIQICTRVNKAGFYTLVCIGISLILQSFFNFKQPRYIFNIFPLILLVSSYGLCNLFRDELNVAYSTLQNHKSIKYLSSENSRYVVLVCLSVLWLSTSVIWFRDSLGMVSRPIHQELGGEHHAQWKEACQYVKSFYKTGDVIVSTISLNALYYCGAVNYALDKAHYIGSSDFSTEDGKARAKLKYANKKDGFYIDYYTNAKTILNLSDLKRVLSENPRGWLILDKQRFEADTLVSKDVREFINKNLINRDTESDETMLIFSWDKSNRPNNQPLN